MGKQINGMPPDCCYNHYKKICMLNIQDENGDWIGEANSGGPNNIIKLSAAYEADRTSYKPLSEYEVSFFSKNSKTLSIFEILLV